MKLTTAILAAVAATMIGGLASAARAEMIDGTIGFSFPNGGGIFGASGITQIFFNPAFSVNSSVNSGTGDYSGTVGSQVSFIPINLACNRFMGCFYTLQPDLPLWSFPSGGKTYSFDLLHFRSLTFSSSVLNFQGSGIAHITGFEDTKATFSLHGTGSGFTYTFLQGNTVVSVPDNGSAFWLLGIALVAIEGARRLKFAPAT